MKYQAKIAFASIESTSDFGNVCIPLEGQYKNIRTSQEKKQKHTKKILKASAHHSWVPSHDPPECYQICHHFRARPVWEPCTAWARVESPYRARPSSKWPNEDYEGSCGCAIPMLNECSARWRERDKKISTFTCILNFYFICMCLCIATTT